MHLKDGRSAGNIAYAQKGTSYFLSRWPHQCQKLWTAVPTDMCLTTISTIGESLKNVVFWDIKPQFVPHRRHITSPLQSSISYCYVRFEVFTAVTMKNVVFWVVMPCGSCKNRHFRVRRIGELGTSAVTSNQRTLRRNTK
jgi:hypothetical protein